MEDFPIKDIPFDIPDWSENFVIAGYDPALGVDVFCHLGRWRKDITLWRQLVVVSLPDHSFIISRAIGDALASDRGPGGPNLAMEVVEDGRRVRWRFLGGARRFSGEFLRNALPVDGPMERLSIDLDFRSDLPLWDLGGAGKATGFAGHGHTEQIGRAHGTIRFGTEDWRFDSQVNRDHSRGPRVQRHELIRHLWCHGIFDNGAKFYLYEVHEGDEHKPKMGEAAVVIDGVMHKAGFTVHQPIPTKDPLDHIFDPVRITFDYPGGALDVTAHRFPTSSYQQYTIPSESYLGARQIGLAPCRRLMEQSVLFRLADGTPGYGHMERTLPGRLVDDDELAF